MYDNNRLVTALDGLVGWRDEEIDDLSYISESLQISLTGLYFNDTHPLLTIKNIKFVSSNITIPDIKIVLTLFFILSNSLFKIFSTFWTEFRISFNSSATFSAFFC